MNIETQQHKNKRSEREDVHLFNSEILEELSENISNETVDIFGTGSVYKFLEPYFKELNIQVGCFLEVETKNSFFEGKEVYSLEEYISDDYCAKRNKIVICSSLWTQLKIPKKAFSICDIYIPFGEESWKLYVDLLPIKTLEAPFDSFINKDGKYNNHIKDKAVLIFIAERSGKTHPYHAMLVGILLNQYGYKVEYLFNDLSIYGDIDRGSGFVKFQNEIIENKLEKIKLKYGIKYSKLSQCEEEIISPETEHMIGRFIYLNYIWLTKKVFCGNDKTFNVLHESFTKNARKINCFLINNEFDLAYVWTGLHAEWSIFRIILENMNIDYISSEYLNSGYYFSRNSPVCYQQDLIRVKNKLKLLTNTMENPLSKVECKSGVLIPLNIFWDSASFTDYDIFESISEWLVETIDYVLNTCKSKVYVRQHPAEKKFSSGDDMKEILLDKFGLNKNFVFFDKNSPQNTYELLEKVNVVLPNTTTFGLEATSLGKTVIVKNSVYYCNEPGIIKAKSKQDYFKKISQNLIKPNIPTYSERENAKKILELKEYNYTTTEFGNYYRDFSLILEKEIGEILKIESVKLALNVFEGKETILEANLRKNSLI